MLPASSDGTPVAGTITPLDVSKVGDDTIGFEVKATQSGQSFYVDFVLIRKGGRLVALVLSDLSVPDQQLLGSLAKKAAAKL